MSWTGERCVFCGDDDKLYTYCEDVTPLTGLVKTFSGEPPEKASMWYVHCLRCGACGPTSSTESGAMELWNRHRGLYSFPHDKTEVPL